LKCFWSIFPLSLENKLSACSNSQKTACSHIMKLLFDECLPKRLKHDFRGHEAFTVDDAGFKGLENGDLLRAASGRFDVLITVDRKLPREHDISLFDIGVVVVISHSNRYEDLKPLLLKILDKLGSIRPGQVIEITRR
jgi:hypothetical protein